MKQIILFSLIFIVVIFGCNDDEYLSPPDTSNIPVDSFLVGYFNFTFRGDTFNFVGQNPEGIPVSDKPILTEQSVFDENRQEYFFLNVIQWQIDETILAVGLGLATKQPTILNALDSAITGRIAAMEATFPIGTKPICNQSPSERLYVYFRDINGRIVTSESCNPNDSFEVLETQILTHPDLGTVFGIHATIKFELYVQGQPEFDVIEGEMYYHYDLPKR